MNLQTNTEFGEHSEAWNQLVADSPRPNPFLRTWWLENTIVGDPLILMLFEGDELMGGLALQAGKRGGVEYLELAGTGPLVPDQMDIVAKRGMEQRVRAEIAMWMRRPGNRVVDLVNIAGDSQLLESIRGTGGSVEVETAPYITLPETADEYLASLPGQMRSTIKRTAKRLAKAQIEFSRIPAEENEAALQTLRELHDGRWGDESQFLSLWDSFSAAIMAGSERGEVQFSQLAGPDGPIAIEVDFKLGDRLAFYQSGRLTDHEYRGSGSVLRYEIIAGAIADGLVEFDLLLGGEEYKSAWATGTRPLYRDRRGIGPRGRAVAGAAHANFLNSRRKDAARLRREAEEAAPTRVMFYTDSAQMGGAESVAMNLLAGLDNRIEVTIAGTNEEVVGEIAKSRPKAETVILPEISDKTDFAAMSRHRKVIAEVKPHIFHANLGSGSSCQYAIVAALTVSGVKVIAVENSPMGVFSEASRKLKATYCRGLSAHVAVGEATARLVEEDVGLSEGSVSVIPNGVPQIEHQPPPRRGDGLVVGTVSRFDPVKGLDVLIEAMVDLDGVEVEIIGDGPQRAELEALAEELGVSDRLVLSGFISGARHHLPNFDVFVLPSRLEGMPMSILEAMHAGVAVVATDVGSVTEVLQDGVTGRVVQPGDPKALAKAIKELLEDEPLRRKLAEAGQQRAISEFSSSANTAAFEELYRSLR